MAEPINTTLILLAVTLFFVGIMIGWIMSNHAELSTHSKLKAMVAVVITIGWITSTISAILIVSYTVSPFLHALMGAIVGYFFTEDGLTFNIGGE
jgi:uncharacterized membrane protein YciS (DUF1049 family)